VCVSARADSRRSEKGGSRQRQPRIWRATKLKRRSRPTSRRGWTGCRAHGGTIVGSIAGAISAKGSGINISSADIAGWAASLYAAGACVGALLFGRLTGIFGRKRLFMITVGVYLAATFATALASTPVFFCACRFITGVGIGGEYSAINSAIDELIPAQHRGRIDTIINGTYWAGAAAGALLSVAALHIFAPFLQWRVCFGLGFILGLGILTVRRHVPESPRWQFSHGREQEADAVTRDIERFTSMS
jgi:MFS family permease